MKYLAVFLFAVTSFAANPGVREVKAVYLLPMTNGLDQFLASKLTSEGIVQVVTDPLKADAILTDKVGTALEKQMAELYAPKPEPKKDDEKKPKENESLEKSRVGTSSWGRGRGNIFLVERATGNVLWSTPGRPKDGSPKEVTKTAAKVTEQLKKDRI